MNDAAKVQLLLIKSKIVRTFLDYNPKKAWIIGISYEFWSDFFERINFIITFAT